MPIGRTHPPIFHSQILARSQERAHSFRATAEWLRVDHGIEVTREAVRKLVRRIERLSVPPAPAEEGAEQTADPALAEPAA